MFIGIAMFFVLMLMGGLIAFLGDKIGSKVGKKRMTLFGLRPKYTSCLLYTSPSPRDRSVSRMPSSA